MSGGNEIETFRRFFANMETGDLMKCFLESMEGKPTPIKLKILNATLKNFDNLYREKSKKVKEDVRYRMLGAMDYLLSREEERKAEREVEIHHEMKLRGLRRGAEKRLKAIKIAEMNKLVEEKAEEEAQEAATQAVAQAAQEAAQAVAQAATQEAAQAVAQAAAPSTGPEQEEGTTGCYGIQCPFMGGNKSRKTRRIRKTKKYKKRKTRKTTKKRKTRKTTKKHKTKGGKKNKRKKKQTRKR